jgi:putative spermidine/putrescine transport system substrate-binding protein
MNLPAVVPALACVFALALTLSGGAHGQSTLVVSSQGFSDKAIKEYIVPRMKQLYGVSVATSPALSSEALAKAIAQKSSPKIDVFLIDAGPWLQARRADLWAKMDPASIKNLAALPARDRTDHGAAYAHLVLGLLYNSKLVNPPPKSLLDLWDKRFAGKVSIPAFNSTFAFALLAKVNEIQGGDSTKTFDPGFSKLKQLAPSVYAFHGSGSQLVNLLTRDEIEIAWGGSYVAHQLGPESGIKWVAASEGAVLSSAWVAIAAGAPNMEAAAQFVDLLLSPEFQAYLAEQTGSGYVNPSTQVSPEFAKRSPLTRQMLEKGEPAPWGIYNERRVQLNERWQREIEAK